MKEIETDVAIIGGGCAGMAAAATAAERGVRVIAFEKGLNFLLCNRVARPTRGSYITLTNTHRW